MRKKENNLFDFTKDPLSIKKEGSWITADGTTLGTDNGIGVAAALAVLESTTKSHPPIEYLFTSQEELFLSAALAGWIRSVGCVYKLKKQDVRMYSLPWRSTDCVEDIRGSKYIAEEQTL
jgi:hypothetical protein